MKISILAYCKSRFPSTLTTTRHYGGMVLTSCRASAMAHRDSTGEDEKFSMPMPYLPCLSQTFRKTDRAMKSWNPFHHWKTTKNGNGRWTCLDVSPETLIFLAVVSVLLLRRISRIIFSTEGAVLRRLILPVLSASHGQLDKLQGTKDQPGQVQ